MDIIKKEGIKVPNSLIVSGLTGTPIDEEICDYLKRYGKISCMVVIDDGESELNTQAIFEYESGDAVEALEPVLPLERVSSTNPSITHCVKTLASVYSSRVGTKTTHTFLSELKGIAKMSGKSFEDILREELNRITTTLSEEAPVETRQVVQLPVAPVPLQAEDIMIPSHCATTEPNPSSA